MDFLNPERRQPFFPTNYSMKMISAYKQQQIIIIIITIMVMVMQCVCISCSDASRSINVFLMKLLQLLLHTVFNELSSAGCY